jgi:hypothetical protein
VNETVRLAGTGSFLPPTVMDNEALFGLTTIQANFDVERARSSLRKAGAVEEAEVEVLAPVEVFDRWARQVTGIRERRILDRSGGLTTEDMCAEAARRALRMAGMDAGELDLILVATTGHLDYIAERFPEASRFVALDVRSAVQHFAGERGKHESDCRRFTSADVWARPSRRYSVDHARPPQSCDWASGTRCDVLDTHDHYRIGGPASLLPVRSSRRISDACSAIA